MTRKYRFRPHQKPLPRRSDDWQAPDDFGRRQAPVEVPCEILRDNDRDNALLITDGSVVEKVDPETGEITEEPKKISIPRSHIISIEPAADGNGAIVTMSEYIAKDRGLI